MKLRAYRDVEDYWRLRTFLRETIQLYGHREVNWHVARLDYWWWFANPCLEKLAPERHIFVWELEDGTLAGAINPEGPGQAFWQVHPAYKTAAFEDELLAAAEDSLAVPGRAGGQRLQVFCDSQDRARPQLLAQHGYARLEKPDAHEVQHRRRLDAPLPERPEIPGYTIRALGAGLELLERCYASGLGFHNDDIQTARENRDQPAWYHCIQAAPLYRRDLDLVAVAGDGAIAAFCTTWFDDVSRTAYIEPVATVPAHRRRGLGRALLLEGLLRLQQMGCKTAFVSGYSQAANGLYFDVMGPEHDTLETWEKEW